MIYSMMDRRVGPALLLIDIQNGFGVDYWSHWAPPGGGRNNPGAERIAGRLLACWRDRHFPVYHARHNSLLPTSPLRQGHIGNSFSRHVVPTEDEPVYAKTVNSAFIGTNLESDLHDRGVEVVVIAGIQTDHCVSTTARMAGNLGFETAVVADACATFDRAGPDGVHYSADIMHGTALASLHNEFATVVTAVSVLNMLSPG